MDWIGLGHLAVGPISSNPDSGTIRVLRYRNFDLFLEGMEMRHHKLYRSLMAMLFSIKELAMSALALLIALFLYGIAISAVTVLMIEAINLWIDLGIIK